MQITYSVYRNCTTQMWKLENERRHRQTDTMNYALCVRISLQQNAFNESARGPVGAHARATREPRELAPFTRTGIYSSKVPVTSRDQEFMHHEAFQQNNDRN